MKKTLAICCCMLGLAIVPFAHAEIKVDVKYKDGKKHGLEKTINNGVLLKEFHYKEGKLDGTGIIYSVKGEIDYKIKFVNGRAVSGTMYFLRGTDGIVRNNNGENMTNADFHRLGFEY